MEAYINISTDGSIGAIDRKIYGHFTEHLGSCIYGGLWAEKHFPGSVEKGYRSDVLELVRALKPPATRWPGGCFSEYYHWEDGIGPREQRPLTYDWLWDKPEPNHVGTHEFMDLCGLVETEPVFAANFRTGSPEEAAAWIAYCNDPASTEQGRRRAANGAEQPFNVKIWDIGNEGWDLTAEAYAARVHDFATAMRAADPEVKLVAVGGDRCNADWNEAVLRACGDVIDYIAPHHYTGFGGRNENNEASFYDNVACAHAIEESITQISSLLDRMYPNRPEIGVAFDEWGVWWQNNQGLRHNYDVSDAIVAASVLNSMQRHCKRVTMANWAQLVNCLGMIQADAINCAPTPVYQVFWMFSNLAQERALRVSAESGSFPVSEKVGVGNARPLIDAMATASDDGDCVVVTIANRAFAGETAVRLEVDGVPAAGGEMWMLDAPGPFTLNTTGKPDACRVVHRKLDSADAVTLPPHTVATIRLRR